MRERRQQIISEVERAIVNSFEHWSGEPVAREAAHHAALAAIMVCRRESTDLEVDFAIDEQLDQIEASA